MVTNSSNSSQSVRSAVIKWETSATKALLAFLDTRKEALNALKKNLEGLMSRKDAENQSGDEAMVIPFQTIC
ncbi:11672_t:CDS:2 [Ambispora leptoticha]|uniref:11672_t:CDS:1 n=1 Tax=Ambispora leptoticha TaxID=144679 RepID=A0A9N9B5B4_9GLOM|nr:11672_t:CDS:2 [Ambispora leptoticha]